ncbi:short-chain dehydrogenase [candidate division MSBL1 archaeon SCGC-AAA259O05]|uniref:Short-chain dehydrogenase n=1 Tax=candidate division MSBL1 archaeon SCGC-AAA259O05 TaxID=1698271 RepID=A0A133V4K5_9EURY|nr:short-chain dehydrogenase [candidate division MSBL1 archaeon SCGC-AAA259O05]
MSVLDKFDISGKNAIVTGAGRGLGKEMATSLAEAGANIVVAEKDGEMAEKSAQEIGEMGTTAFSIQTDVTEEDQVKSMIREAENRLGEIDILVNNAGVVNNAPAEEMTLEEWEKVVNVNMTGVFLCSKHVGKHMIENGGGNIINISSMSALVVNVPQPQISYNSSKAGVIMITKSLASEWAEHGIRVNAIAPGYMRTDLVDEVLEEDPEMEETWISNTPMGRLGRPEELGGVVVFLASEASSYMTGEVVVFDGGYTIR